VARRSNLPVTGPNLAARNRPDMKGKPSHPDTVVVVHQGVVDTSPVAEMKSPATAKAAGSLVMVESTRKRTNTNKEVAGVENKAPVVMITTRRTA